MKRPILYSLGLLAVANLVIGQVAPSLAKPPSPKPVLVAGNYDTKEGPVVQLAILLDTSNSMDGLIDQAKSQLWRIVGEFETARRHGKAPHLEVALYEYGKSSLSAQEGYLRQIVPMTTDLDRISEELFKLKTNGGEEYCGWVIHEAVGGLNWSKDHDALKMIFIAGNEPFTQGPKDFHVSVKEATAKDIFVNTIFCGNYQEGAETMWKDGAMLGNGRYLAINQDDKAVQIDAPQDKEIARLGGLLNTTYIPYGKNGKESYQRQEAQDKAAGGVSNQASVQRSNVKAGAQYNNNNWDLGDATRDGTVKLDYVNDADLPAEMKNLTPDQRKVYVQKKLEEREKIQKQIKQLNAERDRYVATEMKKHATKESRGLDSAVIGTLRAEGAKKDISF